MGKKTESRETRAIRRGAGVGRPRKDGARYPNGRLKPDDQPNPRVLAIRALLGVTDPRRPCTPLRLAHDRGWLTDDEYSAGNSYADTYKRAQVAPRMAAVVSDSSIQSGVEDVPLDARISDLTNREIARVWDSAMRYVIGYEGPERAQERSEAAMLRWKAMARAMTNAQRHEVDQLCLREAWPEWILQRATGAFTSSAEKQRAELVSGLAAIGRAVAKPKPANDDTRTVTVPKPANDHPAGRVRTERTIYVDDQGAEVLTVERRTRRPS